MKVVLPISVNHFSKDSGFIIRTIELYRLAKLSDKIKIFSELTDFHFDNLIPTAEKMKLLITQGASVVTNYSKLSESEQADVQASQMAISTIAGRFAIIPPFMPGRRLVATTLDNLHIYTQKHTRRFRAEFVDDRKVYQHSYLRNEGYGLDDTNLYAAIDENAFQIEEGVFSL